MNTVVTNNEGLTGFEQYVVKKLAAELGKSMETVAKEMNIPSRSTLSNAINNTYAYNPSDWTCFKIRQWIAAQPAELVEKYQKIYELEIKA